MKVFLSLPMSGRRDEDIVSEIEEMEKLITENHIFGECEVEFVHNLVNDVHPEDCIDLQTPALLYLGEAIRKMSFCDAVVFSEKSDLARECRIEHHVATEYGIPTFDISRFKLAIDWLNKEEKIRKLKGQLSTAGDRRDWDECERIEKEIEELGGR